jgi:CBS domain-containing protein
MQPDDAARYGTVRDWMTRAPDRVPSDCPIEQALAHMTAGDVRHLLVVEGDRLVGIVSNRDLGRLLGSVTRRSLAEPVSAIMTEMPVTVAPETSVTEATRLLLEMKIGALPVREGDDIVGIFTTSDGLWALLAVVERTGA